jgi:hypothetical protein
MEDVFIARRASPGRCPCQKLIRPQFEDAYLMAMGQVFDRQLALVPEEHPYGTSDIPQYVQHDRRSSPHRAGILTCLGADEFSY